MREKPEIRSFSAGFLWNTENPSAAPSGRQLHFVENGSTISHQRGHLPHPSTIHRRIQRTAPACRGAGVDEPADGRLRRQDRRHRHLRWQGQLHCGGHGGGGLWPGPRLWRADARRHSAGYRLLSSAGGASADPPLHLQHPRCRGGGTVPAGAGGPDPQPPDGGESPLPHPYGYPLCRGPVGGGRHRSQHLQPVGGLGGLLHHLR